MRATVLTLILLAGTFGASSAKNLRQKRSAQECDPSDPTCEECNSDEFQCDDRYCLPNHWVCDGYDDCGENEDEEEEMCAEREAQEEEEEEEGGQTLDDLVEQFRPDLVEEVEQGESEDGIRKEEFGVNDKLCNEDHFLCDGDVCMPEAYRCDGFRDCHDGVDEFDCQQDYLPVDPVMPVEPVHPHPPHHPPHHPIVHPILPPHPPIIPTFHHLKDRLESLLSHLEESHSRFEWIDCDGGQVVIRREMVCDGYQHCMDGKDEKKCHHGHDGNMWSPLHVEGGLGHVRPVVIKIGYPFVSTAERHHSRTHPEIHHPQHPHHMPMMHHGHHDNNEH